MGELAGGPDPSVPESATVLENPVSSLLQRTARFAAVVGGLLEIALAVVYTVMLLNDRQALRNTYGPPGLLPLVILLIALTARFSSSACLAIGSAGSLLPWRSICS